MNKMTEGELLTMLGPAPSTKILLECLTTYFERAGLQDVAAFLNSEWSPLVESYD